MSSCQYSYNKQNVKTATIVFDMLFHKDCKHFHTYYNLTFSTKIPNTAKAYTHNHINLLALLGPTLIAEMTNISMGCLPI